GSPLTDGIRATSGNVKGGPEAAPHSAKGGAPSVALRFAFVLPGYQGRGSSVVDAAGPAGRRRGRGRVPSGRRIVRDSNGDAGRNLQDQVRRRGRVGHVVGEVVLFRRQDVVQIALHRGDVRLLLRVRELGDGDGGQDPDDHDDDQKLDQGKPTTLAHYALP